jgi:hypothetical protein
MQKRWDEEKATRWHASVGPLRGCNYLPRTAINATEMWQAETFDSATIDQELGWAQAIGYTNIRIFIQYLVWKHDPAGMKGRLRAFLDIAERHKSPPRRFSLMTACSPRIANRTWASRMIRFLV